MNLKIDGMMHVSDLTWLEETAKKMNSIVEIGCWKGRSTHALLSGCKGTVHAIDPFYGSTFKHDWIHKEAERQDVYSQFIKNVGHFKNLKTYKMTSMDAVIDFNDTVDMVFIDGEHRYKFILEDINEWLPKTTKLICGHDIKHPPVEKAVGELLGDYKVTKKNIWYKELHNDI